MFHCESGRYSDMAVENYKVLKPAHLRFIFLVSEDHLFDLQARIKRTANEARELRGRVGKMGKIFMFPRLL